MQSWSLVYNNTHAVNRLKALGINPCGRWLLTLISSFVSLRYFVNDISDWKLLFWSIAQHYRFGVSKAAMEIGWYHTGNHSTMPLICTILNPLCNFIIVTHVIILPQVSSDDYYEMKFQMLKEVQIVLKYWLFKLVHTCTCSVTCVWFSY